MDVSSTGIHKRYWSESCVLSHYDTPPGRARRESHSPRQAICCCNPTFGCRKGAIDRQLAGRSAERRLRQATASRIIASMPLVDGELDSRIAIVTPENIA